MSRGRGRNWWLLAAVAGAAAFVAWLLYLIWRSPHRDSLATYGAFVFPVVALVAGWLPWAWRKGKSGRAGDAASGENLDRFADRLATAVQEQWDKAAGERELTNADPIPVTWGIPLARVAGSAAAAAASHRFRPLPGIDPAREADLASGQAADLHAVYGGLRSGRLIITGPPGSGKTGAAMLLVLAALRHRREVPAGQRPDVPVPVLFTAQDWNPRPQPVADWLIGKLQATYPQQLAGATGAAIAKALLDSGRITVILDGLDEISPELRSAALQALSRQATFRLVLLGRTSEMAAAAAAQGGLQGAAAVELNPVGPADAAGYLRRTQLYPLPQGWQELINRILTDPDRPLSRALNNPLTLTLVKDTYHGEDIWELLDFCDTALAGLPVGQAAEAITGHLLDRVLPAAYTPVSGQEPPPYDLATAQRALTRIAAQMNKDGTRDLNWWQIPRWAPPAPRPTINAIVFALASGLAGGLTGGLAVALASGLVGGLTFGLAAGPAIGLAGGLAGGLVSGLAGGLAGGLTTLLARVGNRKPRAVGDLRITKALTKKNLTYSLASGLVVGLTTLLASGLAFGLASGLVGGLAGGLVVGLVVGLTGGLVNVIRADPDSTSSMHPIASWQGDRRYGLTVGLTVGLVVTLAFGLASGLSGGGLVGGLMVGLVVGSASGLTGRLIAGQSWVVTLAFVQLAARRGTPVRLMRFLDDAHHRDVLRAVGPSYQFRHARLQDRLAAAAATSDAAVQASCTSGVSATAGEPGA